ncbi:MAG: hypothetical protein RI560_05660 [Natronomonas sp.]|nr:hypothetical protein [Natronomonas sp.]
MADVTCADYGTLREFFTNGHFIRGWDCAMTGGDAATQLMFASVIFGSVGLGLFVTTGSVVMPAVLAILLGGAILTLLPATFVNLALVAVLLLLGGLGLLVAFRSGR